MGENTPLGQLEDGMSAYKDQCSFGVTDLEEMLYKEQYREVSNDSH